MSPLFLPPHQHSETQTLSLSRANTIASRVAILPDRPGSLHPTVHGYTTDLILTFGLHYDASRSLLNPQARPTGPPAQRLLARSCRLYVQMIAPYPAASKGESPDTSCDEYAGETQAQLDSGGTPVYGRLWAIAENDEFPG